MTEGDIKTQIGEAAVERKQCLDKISCYKERLKKANRALSVLLDPENNPLHEDNHQLLKLKSDPREDAKGYVATVQHADELTEFLKKHNAS